MKEVDILKIYEYLFKEGVGEAFRTVSCCFHTAAYFIKRLSSRRKASSEQRGGGAESLLYVYTITAEWGLHRVIGEVVEV